MERVVYILFLLGGLPAWGDVDKTPFNCVGYNSFIVVKFLDIQVDPPKMKFELTPKQLPAGFKKPVVALAKSKQDESVLNYKPISLKLGETTIVEMNPDSLDWEELLIYPRDEGFDRLKGASCSLEVPPSEIRGDRFGLLSDDGETDGSCTGTFIHKKKLPNQSCRYRVLLAAHCLKMKQKGTTLTAMKLIHEQIGNVQELEVAVHDKFVPTDPGVVNERRETNYDVGIVSFTAPCLGEDKIRVYDVSSAALNDGESCEVLSDWGPLPAKVDVLTNGHDDFDVVFDTKKSLYQSHSPQKGFSGAGVTQSKDGRPRLIGCLNATYAEDKKRPELDTRAICSGPQCMDWVLQQLKEN